MPLIPAYRSRAGADLAPADTAKPSLGFATTPVAPKGVPACPDGRCTGSGPDRECETPAPSYEVDVLLSRLVTTADSCSGNTTPQGSLRFGSVLRAVVPATSATRLVRSSLALRRSGINERALAEAGAGFTVRTVESARDPRGLEHPRT
jgi:hypothetical protein